MDDPLFDPWCLDEEPAPAESRARPRWRSPESPGPMVPEPPAALPDPVAKPAPPRMPRSRLTGTAGFLRTMAVPRFQDTALRLSMARHEVLVEDLLDGPEPVLRLTLRPWSNPLADRTPGVGRLEVSIQSLEQEYVGARYWVAGPEEQPRGSREDRIPTAKITSSWLESRLLDFVAVVLEDA